MYKSKNHSKFSLKAHMVFITVGRLKQETTFTLWRLFEEELRKHYYKEHTFWSDGYFVYSIGEGASYETIQKYISTQG